MLPASVLWLLGFFFFLTTLISGPQIVYRSSHGLVPLLGATHESKCLSTPHSLAAQGLVNKT